MTVKHIAVVPGDGIGNEVIAAGMVVLDAVSQISSFQMDAEYVDIGSERYLKTGELLTDEDVALLKGKDAIYFGAIGDPRVAPGILEQGILLRMRAVFDQYINLRPATSWFPLVPLKREVPFDIHFLRENTEDFYMGANGTFGPNMGGDSAHVHVRRELYDLDIDINAKSSNNDDFAFEIGLLSKTAVTRFADYCCRYALNRGDRKVTLVDKANVITRNYGMQREIFKEKTAEYGLDLEFMFVDAMAMAMIVRPETFGTVAVPNLFGDDSGWEVAATSTPRVSACSSPSTGPHPTSPDAGSPTPSPPSSPRRCSWRTRATPRRGRCCTTRCATRWTPAGRHRISEGPSRPPR